MNPAFTLSAVEHPHAPTIDPGQEYYDGIVNFLNSKENHSVNLSDLEQELEKRGRELRQRPVYRALSGTTDNSIPDALHV